MHIKTLLINSPFSFRKMDDEILYADFYNGGAMDSFVAKILNKLDKITLMEIIDNVMLRRIFIKFIQGINPPNTEFESMNLLKRYIICQKIILKNEVFENNEIYDKLIKLCPTFLWQQRIKSLAYRYEKDLNFLYVMEKLKWESVIELICHDDYKSFLTAIKFKSKSIKQILINTYKIYYY